jgi:hypothetical protein
MENKYIFTTRNIEIHEPQVEFHYKPSSSRPITSLLSHIVTCAIGVFPHFPTVISIFINSLNN